MSKVKKSDTYRYIVFLRVIRGWLKKSLEESNTKFIIWSDLMGENLDSSLPKGILLKHLNGMRPDIIKSTTTTDKEVDTRTSSGVYPQGLLTSSTGPFSPPPTWHVSHLTGTPPSPL
jgi:hypothetical protein